MIHHVIQVFHSMLELIFWIYYFIWLFYIFPCIVKQHIYLIYLFGLIKQNIYLLNSILSVRFSNSLWGTDVFLFSEFINIVFILFYNFIEFIILFYTFCCFFSRYKEYIICLISFSKFSDVLPAFTYVRAIGSLWSICLGLDIFNPFPCFALYLASNVIEE